MLSSREKQILHLIAYEYTTSEIARLLHIANDTVKSHRKSLLTKIGARNVAGLIRRAVEFEMLPLERPAQLVNHQSSKPKSS